MDWLKKLRLGAKMTQVEVARIAEVTQPSYANIEAGRRTPSVPTAKKIAAALGFDWQRFYDEPSEEART